MDIWQCRWASASAQSLWEPESGVWTIGSYVSRDYKSWEIDAVRADGCQRSGGMEFQCRTMVRLCAGTRAADHVCSGLQDIQAQASGSGHGRLVRIYVQSHEHFDEGPSTGYQVSKRGKEITFGVEEIRQHQPSLACTGHHPED
ncbi:hypothetical protein DOTSEDRAFT_75146 [Dothistroma septosporum NZE10]|uniref:Uncharacterized protein n=1 Tax=Dothistroma septosporum (strain NZE10 / CBS 128990) TaxID=675120 RepID=M2XIR0_DOTSN|nr:hypothetical protein DOTSEDRAFT_75146 [Dothistroma septosporum NZE10]